MTFIILLLTLLMSFTFTRLAHPLSMGLMLLIQTVVVCMMSGLSAYSFWFSYILFLIFLGGMLVLFIYVASLASNEPFFFSFTSFLSFMLVLISLSLLLLFLDPLSLPTLFLAAPSSLTLLPSSTPHMILWLYNNPSMGFTLFIIVYLLLTLIVVVKITSLFKGPLRLSS
uniref:NADH-ubiquinone oxidoreductase chain 6 n=1 Tax=Ranina ranina TaxID=156228 RepID=W6JGX5_RANRA|nr:NADH dehydrogenase subunit 6 [Ranina ranina]AIK66990.1 NADH dehydrogenase subunit 6 [Ranina ranina]BAO48229.1 NADH dehydrogenase subunit 6 [Ranina ranina]